MSLREPVEALNLDIKQQRGFINYYNSLPEKPATTLRFFSHTDFYTLYGNDAIIAYAYLKSFVKYMGDEPKLPYIVLRLPEFEQYVRELLLVKQYRVEVYVKTNKINEWILQYTGSPGNLSQFENILFEGDKFTFSNYVMAVKIVKGRLIAVACVSTTELKFQICEVVDNECYTELEGIIAQIGPKECIIQEGETAELITLNKLLERNNVTTTKLQKSDFSTKNIHQDLDRLLFFPQKQQRNSLLLPECELVDALDCLNAAIKFLNLISDEQNYNQYKLSKLDLNRFVRLDNAALYSLNILPKLGNSTKSFSLLKLLDTCVTNQGKRLLEQWLKQPLKDYDLINERLDIVECLVKRAEIREEIRSDCLSRLTDLLLLSKKLSSKKGTIQDCHRVYQIVDSVPKLMDVLTKTKNGCVKTVLIDPINCVYSDLIKYQELIEETLDLDSVEKGEFLLKSSCDEKLQEINKNKLKIEEKMNKLLKYAADDLSVDEKTIRLENNEQYGYYFRVTLMNEQSLRSMSKYQILSTIKGGVRFTTKQLENLNEDYNEIKRYYEEEQSNLLEQIFDIASGYGDSLRTLNFYIAAVDVLVSFANVSVTARIPYIRPKLLPIGSKILKLIKVRHPCIEQQDHINYIPNDVDFDQNQTTLHIITGPNMCGKSTYIRSVGICVLMAQIGCLVPCEYAEISIVDAILSRVGADDCQLKGLSTFMLEMMETSTIIKTATSNSLVIIDELGRGTSTYDGCGIAWAIAESLATQIKCCSLFATHFHEITRLSDMHSCINNLHVTAVATDNTITPLYQIRDGATDNSYGVHCARMVGFPEEVIREAIKRQQKLEHSIGTQFISEYEPALKRKAIAEGYTIIDEVLKKFKKLNDNTTNDEDLREELLKIKTELESCDNLFVKGLSS